MNPSDPSPGTLALLRELTEQFRHARHDLNNVFAVFLALAELGARNPENYERLAKAVLERSPKVLEDLQRFQDALFQAEAALHASSSAAPGRTA